MTTRLEPPSPGMMVEVRGRHYVVSDVRRSELPTDPMALLRQSEPNHIVELSSVEDDGLGEELQVIWEVEPGVRPYERLELPEPNSFDTPARLDAFIDAVRWGAVSSADVKALQSPFRSGIEIEDYQLDPVVRSLQMPRVNLLIGDGTGLGKTIEAGLVAQELVLRHRVRTILIICPASLVYQWRDQMLDKFGLEFRVVDSELMKTLRRSRGLHVNPWSHFPRLITSIDFLKRERPMRLFREVLPAEGQSIFPRRFDLMIVDEAHNVAPSGAGRYATDSLRTTAIRALAPHFEHKLFLTATPHNGYQESFSALLELVDDQRFFRGVEPDRKQLAAVMVRRLKDELTKRWDGTSRFATRDIVPIEVDYTDEERRAHALLEKYAALRRKNAASQEEVFASEFVLKLLKKRMFSSPQAFLSTLETHERSIASAKKRAAIRKPTVSVLKKQIEQMDEDYAVDEAYEEATNEAVDSAVRLFRSLDEEEQKLLNQMKDYARCVSAKGDSKSAKLIAWLHEHIKPKNGKWSDERVLIFTEYRATQKWLHALLVSHGLADAERLNEMYGGLDDEKREVIKAAFMAPPDKSPVRILLATDAASEGIDLHNYCHWMIHYEIPWSPTRMEQRNGRLDRHGQKAPVVEIFHFAGRGFDKTAIDPRGKPGELEGDLEFLARMAIKVNQIREDLGKVGPVIATQVEEAMLGRRVRLDTATAERDAEPVRRMLKFERNLREQVEALRQRLDESRRELRISPENVRAIVEIGLQMAGQPPLQETTLKGVSKPAFKVPALAGSWSACLNGLHDKFTGELRPITFDHDVAAGRHDVVLCHLNHRLVAMCLRVLRAEVWATAGASKLNRVATRIVPTKHFTTPDAIGVVAYGRLVVIGQDSVRLHEELIHFGGFIREGRFRRFDSLAQMTELIDHATNESAPPAVEDRLRQLWPSLKDQALAALEARMGDRTKNLESFLNDRANKEIEDITAILAELKASVERELGDYGKAYQPDLFSKEEEDQYRRNESAMRERLRQIPEEIKQETARIRTRFADPQPRLFPVAVMFLVPERLAKESAR